MKTKKELSPGSCESSQAGGLPDREPEMKRNGNSSGARTLHPAVPLLSKPAPELAERERRDGRNTGSSWRT